MTDKAPLIYEGDAPHRLRSLNLKSVFNYWTRNLDEELDADIVYIYFAKAFDSVSILNSHINCLLLEFSKL